MLLAAGHGTRLRPLTDRVPKAMVPVGGMPVIEQNLRLVARHGVDEVIINLHAHPDAIPAYVGDGSRWGLHVTYSYEERLLGTAGAVKRMEQALDGETFAVIYADNLSDGDLSATLALHVPGDPRASGIVDVDERGRVRGFVEKPGHYDAALGVWANAGIYILEPSVLRAIPAGVPYDFGHDLFPRLLAQGHPLYAAPVCTFFLAIDTPERYAAAQAFFARR
jgi:mannose-1-phosphate guanylyltransferase